MKLCALLLLLIFLSSVLSAVYNFDVKTVEHSNNDFNNELKLQSDLNAELEKDLMKITLGKNKPNDETEKYRYDTAIRKNFEKSQRAIEVEEVQNETTEQTAIPKQIEAASFIGTNLFDSHRKQCFSNEDIALLLARRDLEALIPKNLPPTLLNDDTICVLMSYFYSGYQVIQQMPDDESTKYLTEKAFYDVLGGYLKNYMIPFTKLAFYAGKVSQQTMESVNAIYEQCKLLLNTNGNGWRAPTKAALKRLNNMSVEPLNFPNNSDDGEQPTYCAQLDLRSINNDAEAEQMIVSLPKLDAEDKDGFLSNIWLPFTRKRTYNLRSSRSAGILLKFYETVTRCYRFQSINEETYNQKFKEWFVENIQVHLNDEQFYPGLNGILRIYENLHKARKTASRYRDDQISDNYEEQLHAAADNYDEDDDSTLQKRQKISEYNFRLQTKPGEQDNNIRQWFEKTVHSRAKGKKPKCKPKPTTETALNLEKTTVEPSETSTETDEATESIERTTESVEEEVLETTDFIKTTTAKPSSTTKPIMITTKKTTTTTTTEPAPTTPGIPFSEKFSNFAQRYHLKYIFYIILLILLLLLLIFLCAIVMKRWEKRRREKPRKIVTTSKEKPITSPSPTPSATPDKPPRKKRRSLCDCFSCRRKKKSPEEQKLIKQQHERTEGKKKKLTDDEKPLPSSSAGAKTDTKKTKPADEEIFIKADSKSVISSVQHSTSSSSLACHPKSKCIPCSKKASKSSDAAVIETTSLDYSSSEPEQQVKKTKPIVVTPPPTPPKKAKQKMVTINDQRHESPTPTPRKKRFVFSKCRKECPPCPPCPTCPDNVSSKQDTKRIGLQRGSATHSDTSETEKRLSKGKSTDEQSCSEEFKKQRKLKDQQSTSWDTMYDT